MFSGIVTVVPLLTFTLSLRRLPLLAISFMQFLSPTVQMLIAVTLLGETLTPAMIARVRLHLGGGADLRRRRGVAGAGDGERA